jgi:hypothetical protein
MRNYSEIVDGEFTEGRLGGRIVQFPEGDIEDERIEEAASSIKFGKAKAWDCVPDELFRVKEGKR